MNHAAFEVVPLTPSLTKLLYEAIVTLYCLIATLVESKSIEATESDVATPKTRKQTYYCFVNKLGQICDSRRGGKTVAAFAVMQPGNVEYRFACNERKDKGLAQVTTYITDILDTLGKASPNDVRQATKAPDTPLFSELLQKILHFNRPRLERYVEVLADSLEFCINISNEEDSDQGMRRPNTRNALRDTDKRPARAATADLEALDVLVQFARTKPKVGPEEFVRQTQTLLHAMNGRYKTTLREYIQDKCSELTARNDWTPWHDIYHAIGRLLSYFTAVKVLLKACTYWPELFVDFTVAAIPSSRAPRDPPSMRKCPDKIIPLMTHDKGLINFYRQNANALPLRGLEGLIREVTHHTLFKPIVHAEVLVDDSVRRDQRAAEANHEPLRFFRQAEFGRYIGASKPTCRLCALYFECQADGVTVRPSHHNTYYKWRAPDVFVSDGERVKRERDETLRAMLAKIRTAVFQAIRDRSAPWARFDSNDTPTDPGVSDLTSQMSAMAVVDVTERGDTPDTVSSGSGGGVDADEEGSEDEEDRDE